MLKSVFAAALLLATSSAALGAPPTASPISPATRARIDRILAATPLIDGHNDIAEQLAESHDYSIANLATGTAAWPEHPLMTDMARLRAGHLGGQFWSVYIDGKYTGDEAIRRTLEQIDIVDRLIAAYPATLERAYTADDIVRIHHAGRIASLIGIEGGRQIGGSMAALRQFYRLGARYMTLTHNQTTEWADSATDEPKYHGLSPFGLHVIGEMNRLGMLIDLSHVSPEVMRQAISASRAPVIFSHSSARALDAHPRNVPDDVLALVRQRGGVVMVNAWNDFVSPEAWAWDAVHSAEEARLKTIHRASKATVETELKTWDAAHPRPRVTIGQVADHIDYVAKLAGHDHVGLGLDLDGIPYTPDGLEGVDAYPAIFAELIRRGWSDPDLAALAGGNTLRAMRRTEATAASMRSIPPSLDKLPTAP